MAITFDDMKVMLKETLATLDAGFDAVVITHGTDTIEETAVYLDAILPDNCTVMMTGAMRASTQLGADGQRNVLDSVVAASALRGKQTGVCVVMNGHVYAAWDVEKAHTTGVDAFQAPQGGVIGEVNELRFVPVGRPVSPYPKIGGGGDVASVELIRCVSSASDVLIRAAVDAGVQGLIIEGLGGGHVPPVMIPALLDALHRNMTVVVTSRTGSGLPLRAMYQATGAEIYLRRRGVLFSRLSGSKARILLGLMLATNHDPASVFVD